MDPTVVFIPGIQGSWLKNEYSVNFQRDVLWDGILTKKFRHLKLSKENDLVDIDHRKLIESHQIIPFAYESFIDEIREEASPFTYVFHYDWRKDCRVTSKELYSFIRAIVFKVSVHSKCSVEEVWKSLVLIGHSMGGLLIKYCVQIFMSDKEKGNLRNIITIATPYKGSLKALEAMVPGARRFFGRDTEKDMRHATRSFPSVYQLLPSYKRAVVDDNGNEVCMLNLDNWQENVVNAVGRDFLIGKLRGAKDFIKSIHKPYDVQIISRTFCIHGNGSNTLQQVQKDKNNKLYFDSAEVSEEGDGTVATQSACLGLSKHHVDDGEFFTDLLGGQHAMMCKHHLVRDWVVAILRESKLQRSFESLG